MQKIWLKKESPILMEMLISTQMNWVKAGFDSNCILIRIKHISYLNSFLKSFIINLSFFSLKKRECKMDFEI